MRKLMLVVAVLALTALFAPEVRAGEGEREKDFVNHLDLYPVQIGSDFADVRVMDFGYHFTTARFSEGIFALGFGAGFDWGPGKADGGGDAMWPYFSLHLVDVPLFKIDAATVFVGLNWTYHTHYKEFRPAIGFSVGWE